MTDSDIVWIFIGFIGTILLIAIAYAAGGE